MAPGVSRRSWPASPCLVALLAAFALYAAPAASASEPSAAGLPAPEAGTAWVPQVSGTTADLTAVSFPDRDSGHVVGRSGTILATRDAGRRWSPQTACRRPASPCPAADRITADLRGVSFADPQHGIAVGAGGTILVTSDGGRSWASRTACLTRYACSPADRVQSDLTAVSLPDDSHGWAVGDVGIILGTSDGGNTWTRQQVCSDLRCPASFATTSLTSVSFLDDFTGLAGGAGGAIGMTTNGGRTWAFSTPSGGGPFPDVHGTSLTIGWGNAVPDTYHWVGSGGAVTGFGRKGGSYLTTGDAALQGAAVGGGEHSGVSQDLNGVWFSDHLHGHAVGGGGVIIATADEGASWAAQPSGTARNLNAVDFPDENRGYAVGDGGVILGLRSRGSPAHVTGVTPGFGPEVGRSSVTLVGSGFTDAREVNFGRAWAFGFVVESDTLITATAPPHAPGTVDVTVVTREGSVTDVGGGDRFKYLVPGGGSWSSGAPCVRACNGPAVVLLDGRVLALGGGNTHERNALVVSAEIYDPAGYRWSLTGSTHVPRYRSSLTRLPDGRVLAAGGIVDEANVATDTAEVYEPKSGEWSRAATMRHPHSGHAAVLLRDGRVLVAGSEIFDPAAGTWSEASAAGPRNDSSLVLLDDGRVLSVGGGGGADARAEIYDPGRRSWHFTGALGIGREGFTTTLLGNGRVLATGGFFSTPNRPDTLLAYAEVFDPALGAWQPTGPMVTPRAHHSATLLPGGKVLVIGGTNERAAPYCPCGTVGNAELYDPATGGWELAAATPTPRVFATSTLLADGSVLVAGGSLSEADMAHAAPSTITELFLPSTREAGKTSTGGVVATAAIWIALSGAVSMALFTGLVAVMRRRAAAASPPRG